MVEAISDTLRAPPMDGDKIRSDAPPVEGAEVLEGIAQEGVPVEIHTGGNLGSELAYGNHRGVTKYGREVLTNAAADGTLGRAI